MSFKELAFTLEEYEQRLARLKESMEKHKVDTVFITSPVNIYYYSGHPGAIAPSGIAVNKNVDGFVAFCMRSEETLLRRTSVAREVYFFGEYDWSAKYAEKKGPYDVITNTLKAKGWLKGNIGVEKWTWYPCHQEFEQLISGFEGVGAKAIDASKAINDVRYIKSPAELVYVRRAGEIADIGIKAAEKAIRPGATELDVVAEIESAMYHAGGERNASNTMVQSGSRSVMQHCESSQKVIDGGDIVSIDFCGVYKRYHADLGRTFCVGKPPKSVADAMKKVAGSLKVVQETIKPGMPLSEVTRVSEEYYRKVGIKPWYAAGYTLGISFPPEWVGVYFHAKGYNFDPGVVTNLDHCFCFDKEAIGTCVIETLVMTENGIECLNNIQRDIIIAES